jgi:tetratricopeptide (TPR) repeat protein
MLALSLANLGELREAQHAAEEALSLSRRTGDRLQEATSLRRLAIVHMNGFEHAKALPLAEAALALHRELGDRSEECNALNAVGVILAWMGRPDEAKRYIDQSLELADAIGSDIGISYAIDNLIWLHFHSQGAYESALEFVETWLKRIRTTDDGFLSWRLQESKVKVLTLLGRFEQAVALAKTLLPVLVEVIGKKTLADYLAHLGRMHAELGCFSEARQYLDKAFEQAATLESDANLAGLLINSAYIALLEGSEVDQRAALDQMQRVLDLLKERDWEYDLVEALNMVARLHLAVGQADLALPYSADAARLAARWPFESESVLITHSRALRSAGCPVEADSFLRRAHERVMLVASKTKSESLRQTWLENIQINREILSEWDARGMDEKPSS